MLSQLLPALRMTLVLTLLTGLLYPGLVTGIAKVIFPRQANGSLIEVNGKVIGSELIGQKFTKPEYFQGRPSAAGDGYDAANSGASNYGPTNRKLVDRIRADAEKFRKENPDFSGPIPSDQLTASASGLDPDLSPAASQRSPAQPGLGFQVSIEALTSLSRNNSRAANFHPCTTIKSWHRMRGSNRRSPGSTKFGLKSAK